jgi:prolyl oligopeptidase PreP (S9A serine peptidase family)
MRRKSISLGWLLAGALCALAIAQEKLNYPKTAKVSHTDSYHGVTVADPYRWLEDDNSPQATQWVAEQNRLTFGYLEKIPFRARLKERLEKIYNYPKIGAPFRRGEYYYFFKNDGLQNQSAIYRQKGLNGQPEVLLDPNQFSPDGTSALTVFSLSKDGKYAAYGVSNGGSDWQELRVMEVATRKTLPDLLKWVKVSGASWQGDGFYYSRYPEPEKGKELSTRNENHQVYFHKVGEPQTQDTLVYEDKANPLRFHGVGASEDERFAFLNISDRGKGQKGNAVFYRDILDGGNPTMLYAYGGFNSSQTPAFSVMLLPFLEQGGVYALANIRGGNEYGERWHEAAVREKRQNAFDDFIAAAEYLIAEKYTSSQKLAIRGGSNGGLLVGAVMNQRPELFKAVIAQAGVMDMLRFHKFTIGWNWIAEFGSSDNAAEFKYLYAYSPLHNIKEGVRYPATLITTADHDDRVVPAHSFKYAATLQEKNAGDNPILIRVETKSGHGASNTAKNIEITADIYAFLFRNLGVAPNYGEVSKVR